MCQALNLGANIDEAIGDIVPHGKNATFIIFSDRRLVDAVIAHHHGKPFVGEYIASVTRITADMGNTLLALKPSAPVTRCRDVSIQMENEASFAPVSLPICGANAIVDAINGLSLEQQRAVQATLQHPSDDLGASYL